MNVTVSELYNRFALAADAHDAPITPTQFLHWATQENLALALFIARLGWTQNVVTTTITVAGDEGGAYPLTDISPLAIVAVHQVRDQRYRQLRYNNVVDFLRQTPGGRTTGDPTEYRLLWDQANDEHTLGFYPEPSVGSVFVVSYIPEPSRLTLDASPAEGYANSVNYPMGWEERIVLGCARRFADVDETDSTPILRQIAETESRIEEAVWNRVLTEHPTVRNLDRQTRGWTDRISFPPPTHWVWV